jgi:hypothetical protein
MPRCFSVDIQRTKWRNSGVDSADGVGAATAAAAAAPTPSAAHVPAFDPILREKCSKFEDLCFGPLALEKIKYQDVFEMFCSRNAVYI